MPGKNQQKRINKSRAHALMVYQRDLASVAFYTMRLKEALAIVQENAGELSEEQVQQLMEHTSTHLEELKAVAVRAEDNYINHVGEDYAKQMMKELANADTTSKDSDTTNPLGSHNVLEV
jgi:hypothetical protein